MADRSGRLLRAALLGLSLGVLPLSPNEASAQFVEDGSDAVIGKADTKTVLDLIARHLKAPDAKVTALRRSAGSVICGSVNVKNKDGLYLGERGFVVDLSTGSFGRVPDGVELLSSRSEGFEEKEQIRQLYFDKCLD